MDAIYRFYDSETGFYLNYDGEPVDKNQAGLFSKKDYIAWGKDKGFVLQEMGEDEKLRLAGHPTIPGL